MPLDALTKFLPNFLLILLRAGIVLMLLPYFGSRNFPAQFKIGIAVAISLVLAPIVEFPLSQAPLPAIVVREIMFGMIFGLAVRFIFFAVDMAGQVMGYTAGMSAASAFNPEIGPSTEVSQIYSTIAMLLFLASDIHHDVIAVFVRSYEWLPAGTIQAGGLVVAGTALITKIFVIALKLSAPVAIIMLITNIIFGFIYKAVPQMNVFFVSQPVHIFIGVFTMMICFPVFAHVLGGYFSGVKDELGRVILMMKG